MKTQTNDIQIPDVNSQEALDLLNALSPEELLELYSIITEELGKIGGDGIQRDLWEMLQYTMSNPSCDLEVNEKLNLFYLYESLSDFFIKLEKFRKPLMQIPAEKRWERRWGNTEYGREEKRKREARKCMEEK